MQKLSKEIHNGKEANAKELSYCINPEVFRKEGDIRLIFV